MYIATLRIAIQPENKTDAIGVLTALCSQADVIPGCLLCRLYETIGINEGDDEVLMIQKWDNEEAMEKHILSPVFQQLIEIMDFATTSPELLFHKVSSTSGIEMVENLRKNKIDISPDDFQ